MSLRRLALVLAVAVSSCGTAVVCDATTCAGGCCDATGRCVERPHSRACGSAGAACQVCLLGAECTAGVCERVVVSTGGAGAAGGTVGAGGGAAGGVVAGGSAGGSTPGNTGRVTVGQVESTGGVAGFAVISHFIEGGASTTTPGGCREERIQQCSRWVCTPDGGAPLVLGTVVSPGVMRIVGTSVDGGVELDGGSGTWFARGWSQPVTLELSTTGGRVPAIPSQRLVAPFIRLVPPLLGERDGGVSNTMPLAIAWSGGLIGQTVKLRLVHPTEFLECAFDARAGSGVVDAQLLSGVVGRGSILVFAESHLDFTVGDFATTFSATHTPLGGSTQLEFR